MSSAKRQIRHELLEKRNALSAQEVRALSSKVNERVLKEVITKVNTPKTVAFYAPIRNEVDPLALMESVKWDAVQYCFPRTVEGELQFMAVKTAAELEPSQYGILAPSSSAPVVVPDLIFVPGVAFSRQFYRLGYGKGYYDRAIANVTKQLGKRPVCVGLAYEFQVLEQVPAHPHDQTLDWIVTEAETLRNTN